jgi:voltage-gated potassium channel Kch
VDGDVRCDPYRHGPATPEDGGHLTDRPSPPTDRYGILFLELVAVLLLSPFIGIQGPGRVVMVLAVGAVVISGLRATGAGQWKRLLVPISVVTVGLAPAALASGTFVQATVLASLAVGMAVGPPNIVRRIFEHDQITAQLVLAGLCAYIQVGFAFAFIFGALDVALPGDFFAQGEVGGFFDYVYFSFVTLTTVGYGDLSAASDHGRALAVLETLIGQIFLVVLVAYLVGTLAGARKSRERTNPEGAIDEHN